MPIEDFVAKHESQISEQLKGRKHLIGLTEDAKLAADRLHIDKVISNTTSLHGNGLFPLKDANGLLLDLNGKVLPSGSLMEVLVHDYLALIDGYILGNRVLDASYIEKVVISPSESQSRIDLICLKPSLDTKGNRQHTYGDIYVVKGVASLNPAIPSIPTGSIPLAEIFVEAGITSISLSSITDRRIYLKNIDELISKIEEVKNSIGLETGLSNLNAMVNIAKVNFKVDSYHNSSMNNLFKGFVDVFSDDSGIDLNLSQFLSLNQELKRLEVATSFDPEMEGYWRFNEESGSVVLDSSGKERHGVLSGDIIRVSGLLNKALKFNTGNVNATCIGLPIFTVSGWINRTVNVGYENINSLGVYGAGQNTQNWLISAAPNYQILFRIQTTLGTTYNLWSTNALNLNNWNFVLGTYDGTTMKLFINGILNSSLVLPVNDRTPITVSNSFSMKAGSGTQIDDVRIYGRTLNQNEIDFLYNNGIGTEQDFAVLSDTATFISTPHEVSEIVSSVLLVADESGQSNNDILYFISRDNGTSWLSILKNQITDISSLTEGSSIRIKVIIPKGKNLENISLWW